MRIDGFQDIPAVLQSLRANRPSPMPNAPDSVPESSTLKLSSFGSVLQSVQRDVAAQSGVRDAKVTAIADAIENGSYTMDLSKLASKLVDLQVVDFRE